MLMGYGFTNLMRESAQQVERLGRAVGGVYFVNILGSTAGSLAIGFLVIHYLGVEHALRLLVVVGCAIPLILVSTSRRTDLASPVLARPHARVMASAVLPSWDADRVSSEGRDRPSHALRRSAGVDFVGLEDSTGVSALRLQRQIIAFSQEAALLGQQRLYIDGSHHGDGSDAPAATGPFRWRLRAFAPAPRAPHRARRRTDGRDGGAMGRVSGTRRCRTEWHLAGILNHTAQGRHVLESGKLRYVVDDGRRWLLAHPQETFDLIMMFPLHAAHAFSGALYSVEFFRFWPPIFAPRGLCC